MGYYKNLVLAGIKQKKVTAKSGKANKKILAFTVCLFVSVLLWVIVSLNKNYNSFITFNIVTAGEKNKQVTARIYGNGFDIIKEKLFMKSIVLGKIKMGVISSEDLIEEHYELDEHLKYSDFEPTLITIK